MFLGFDRSDYPGDAVMRSLWESTPLTFTGFYLAPAPSHQDTGWMAKAAQLRADGWGFLPVYVGQQSAGGPGSHVLTVDQAKVDAAHAAELAAQAGFAVGSVLYLDVEQGGLLDAAHLDYVAAWVAEVAANTSFWAGVYCSYKATAAQVTARTGPVPTWVFHVRDGGPSTVDLHAEEPPDPADSGFPSALAWQYRLSLTGPVDLAWTDGATGTARKLAKVDLDSSTVRDPSSPTEP